MGTKKELIVIAGKMKAFPFHWGTSETKDGKPFVFIDFETEHGTVTWKGYLSSEAAEKITFKAIACCGFKYIDLSMMNNDIALDKTSPVSIEVEEEEYKGKTYYKVKWVNKFSSNERKPIEDSERFRKSLGNVLKDMGIERYIDTTDIPF